MSIYDKLYDWQKKLIDNYKNRDSYGLYLQMGLGKTPISLAFAEQNNCEKILVITINSKALESEKVKGSFLWWAKQSSTNYKLYNKNSKEFIDNPSVFVINYEGLFARNSNTLKFSKKLNDFLDTCKNKKVAIIVDESHKIKNSQSLQTKIIFKLQRFLLLNCDHVYTYLLSGTPFTTGYIDLYTQLKLLGYNCSKASFVDQYCVKGNIPGLLGWQQPIIGYKNINQLYDLIHKYAITIESKDVIDLPEQITIDHTSKISRDMIMFIKEKAKVNEIIKTYNAHHIFGYEKYINTKNENASVNNPFYRNIGYVINDKWLADTPGSFWMRARQLSIGFQGNSEKSYWFDKSRLKMLESFLEQNKDNYIIFYNYTPELLEIYSICEKLKYNIDVYCGECKSLAFYEKYCNLTNSEKLVNKNNIIIANFASGSTGMNWQEYQQCILFSLPLYKDYEQAIARIHRLGQESTTIVHRFYQDSFLDKSMLKSLDECKEYNEKMFEHDLEEIQKILK